MRNLELALSHLEALSAARIDEVIALTQKEIATIKAEKDAIQATMCGAQADLTMSEQLKTQLNEYQTLEELCNGEVAKLTNRVRQLSESQAIVQSNLDQSRMREATLEKSLLAATAASSSISSNSNCHSSNSNGDSGGGSGENGTTTAADSSLNGEDVVLSPAQLVQQAHQRVEEMNREVQNSANNINDLIMEIETVAAEEAKARAQGSRLLKQITECQSMQRVALEENLRLQNQIEELRMSHRDNEAK